jgi:CheY-like chemotaxis protein
MPAALLVEANLQFAELVTMLLARMGLDTLRVETGSEGVQALAAHPLGFVVAVVDLHLPDGPGLVVLEAALRHRQPVPVVLMGGNAAELAGTGFVPLVRPFSGMRFDEAVREAIAFGGRGP